MPILTPEERIGRCVADRYRFEELIATGGMGLLFRGLDTRTQRNVAIKVMKAEQSLEERRVRRFLRETAIAAQLRHPHIVDVLDVGVSEDGFPFLVMELLTGRSLQEELEARNEGLDLAETLAIALPILAALSEVQRLGIVHRDIKPDNIFLSRDAYERVVPKLLDFGIAKVEESTSQTQGAVVGTPMYMAPEQARGDTCTTATDVWSMGAVLWHCIMGRPPFTGATAAEIGAKLLTEAVPSLDAPGMKPAVAAVIERSLVRPPVKRYADAATFMAALTAAAERSGVPLPELPRGSGRTRLSAPQTITEHAPIWTRTASDEAPSARRRLITGRSLAGSLLLVTALGALVLFEVGRTVEVNTTRASLGKSLMALTQEIPSTLNASAASVVGEHLLVLPPLEATPTAPLVQQPTSVRTKARGPAQRAAGPEPEAVSAGEGETGGRLPIIEEW
jgi:eukaryotic-like serine/threonine-protein kinase